MENIIFLNATGVTGLQLHENIFSAYQSLKRLHMASANLTELKGPWFRNSSNLIELNMKMNSLTILKRADLKSLRNLISADFSNNQIGILEETVFSDLPNLEILDLSNNSIENVSSSSAINFIEMK